MANWMEGLTRAALIGIGATVVMDLWVLILKRFGVQTLNFGLLGRWVGHLFRGRVAHDSIANAAPIRNELLLGWLSHYATGIAFAALLMLVFGVQWARSPTLLPAVAVGLGTVVMPFFVMQPAMGAGIASSKTPKPWRNRLRSVAGHHVFGIGLYLAGLATAALLP
jgi:hypothetical protein